MLWNWFTIDACFFSKQWKIKSTGGFAGLCIGVVFLVMFLEALRRLSREYDGYLLRKHSSRMSTQSTVTDGSKEAASRWFTPTALEQVVRAILHMLQFAVAYWIMLFAMYYNGYIIISIIIGAFLGGFLFTWEKIEARGGV